MDGGPLYSPGRGAVGADLWRHSHLSAHCSVRYAVTGSLHLSNSFKVYIHCFLLIINIPFPWVFPYLFSIFRYLYFSPLMS